MRRSVSVKLICIYLIVNFLIIWILGLTIIGTSKRTLLSIRIREITERAYSIAEIISADEAPTSKSIILNMLKGISEELGAVIQITDKNGAVYVHVDSQNVTIFEETQNMISGDIINAVSEGNIYNQESKFNKKYNAVMTTIAIPVLNNHEDAATGFNAIVVIESYDSVLHESLDSVYKRLWIPCVCIIAFGVLLIITLNYGVSLPIMQMNVAAKEISKGNFDKRIYVKSSDEVGQLAQSFNKMAEELSETDKLRSDFIANISHELRTPLTSINGFVQGILDGTIPESETKKYLNIVLSETQRLSKLTRDMLDLSRIESGTLPLNKRIFDINELIRRVIITKAQNIEDENIDLELNFQKEKLFVMADGESIEQVLLNLLDNAVKFTPVNGKISISTFIDHNKIFVSVKDNGKGIKQEDINRIWERFYTENKSRTNIKGTGIGLAIVKKIINQHGENISVQSKEGQGAEFVFSLDAVSKKMLKKNKQEFFEEF